MLVFWCLRGASPLTWRFSLGKDDRLRPLYVLVFRLQQMDNGPAMGGWFSLLK